MTKLLTLKEMHEYGKELAEQIAKEMSSEPVGWMFDQAKYRENDLRGRQWAFNVFSQTKPYMDEMVQNVTPLYRDPTPCQTCEALARTVMMDQTSHDTAPPQREWVGLTEGETIDLALSAFELPEVSSETREKIHRDLVIAMNDQDSRLMLFAANIEAKLKEKNSA